MANHRSREGNRQERRSSSSSGSGLGLLEASSSLFDGLSSFQDLCVETGRSALAQLMEKERELRCGAKGGMSRRLLNFGSRVAAHPAR